MVHQVVHGPGPCFAYNPVSNRILSAALAAGWLAFFVMRTICVLSQVFGMEDLKSISL